MRRNRHRRALRRGNSETRSSSKSQELEAEVHLPDEAPGQLVQIDAMMDDRRQRLEEVKNKRRAIREKAEQLPVSRRMLDLQGRIEAAAEQATWVEALEEQIGRLDVQIEKARQQLEADAERLGMDDEDRTCPGQRRHESAARLVATDTQRTRRRPPSESRSSRFC